jgi:phosphoribosyl 1,2-cyclic phosphodiesterase
VRYISLGSGSKGNATLIEHQGKSLLIDCGFSRKALFERMSKAGADPKAVAAVLVTHEHADHARGALGLCEFLDVPLYTSFGTAQRMEWLQHKQVQLIHGESLLDVADFRVLPVTVPHDAREPLQFVIADRYGQRRVGVLSDLGSLTPHVVNAYRDCHGLQLEANHDPQMLKQGPYPPSLQARVAGNYGHLSNAQCAQLLASLLWSGLQHVTAGHISEKNNNPELVRRELATVMGCAPETVELLVQDGISGWYELK